MVYFPDCREAMPRVLYTTGLYLKFTPLSLGFESRIVRITGFHGG